MGARARPLIRARATSGFQVVLCVSKLSVVYLLLFALHWLIMEKDEMKRLP